MRAVCERASRNCRVVLSSLNRDAERNGPCDVDGIRNDIRGRPPSVGQVQHAFAESNHCSTYTKKRYANDLYPPGSNGFERKIFEIFVDLARAPSLEFACFHERGICLGQFQ